jgi:hypothetical protein
MPSPRIFVQYQIADATQYSAIFAKQFFTGLQTAGAKVVRVRKDRRRGGPAFPSQGSAHCQWFILVQNPEALQSLRVQTTIHTALTLFKQQQVQGLQLMIAAPSYPQNEQCGEDEEYERKVSLVHEEAEKNVLLEIHLINAQKRSLPVVSAHRRSLAKDGERSVSSLPSKSQPAPSRQQKDNHRGEARSAFSMQRRPARVRFAIPSLVLIFLLVIAASIMLVELKFPLAVTRPDLTVTASPTIRATTAPTPTLAQLILTGSPSDVLARATSGQPFIDDPLQSQDGNNRWSENTTSLGGCRFSNGTYHASASLADRYTPCLALADQDSNLQNIAFQAQMTIIQGDVGGLIFHSNASGSNGYAFTICVDPACGKGYYGLYMSQGNGYSQLISGSSTAIKTDLKQTNLLTVVAYNGDIYLYVNDKSVAHIQDNTFISGYIGLTAYELSNSTDVSFSYAQVWKLQG